MNRNLKTILTVTAALAAGAAAVSCDDNRSYAELLTDENHAVNLFLSDQRVVGEVPADSVFEEGPDAPYYQLDSDGNIYMQVIDKGNMNIRPQTDDRVYFRFLRYNLNRYESGVDLPGVGNADDVSGGNGIGAVYFQFKNMTLPSSAAYGAGIQMPMYFLGADAHVKLVVKSQYGWANETSQVIPFLYDIRYYSSPLSPWKSETEENENE